MGLKMSPSMIKRVTRDRELSSNLSKKVAMRVLVDTSSRLCHIFPNGANPMGKFWKKEQEQHFRSASYVLGQNWISRVLLCTR